MHALEIAMGLHRDRVGLFRHMQHKTQGQAMKLTRVR